ncbi:hypothetical protein MMC12_008485 [Toensbergia leucococca]|nr:hypothetical protein [Toensbergia leucococca]
MPKEPQGENLRATAKKEADNAALRKFAELAQSLGFESPEIAILKERPYSSTASATCTLSKPVLVTGGRGENKATRSKAQVEREVQEQEGHERSQQEWQEQERLERERQEQLERERQEQAELEREEKQEYLDQARKREAGS